MKRKKIGLECNGKKISLEALSCNEFEMGRGLMFRLRESAPLLLFEFEKPTKLALTSLFVFFPFLVLWLDDKNKIIGKKVVKSFVPVINFKKSFSKIVEIPINKKNFELVKSLVGEGKDLKRK